MKNGTVRGRKKNLCLNCRKQYVLEQHFKRISQETWELVDKLLLEKLPLAGIARVTGVSERWLQVYVNSKYGAIDKQVDVEPKKSQLAIECDELWSFDRKKHYKASNWLASMFKREKLLVYLLGKGTRKVLKDFGNHFLPNIGSVQ